MEDKPIRGSYRGQDRRNRGPRINQNIRAEEVRVVDADGEMRGVMSVAEGIALAEEAGLDLVEVSPNAKPPVCKVLDYGKYKYEQQKKAAEARKKQKTVDVKEVKIRPNTEEHDYQVKMRNVKRFLGNGDKVKVSMRFRGREMAHQNLGMEMMKRMLAEVEDISKIEQHPRMEGRQMIMILAAESADE